MRPIPSSSWFLAAVVIMFLILAFSLDMMPRGVQLPSRKSLEALMDSSESSTSAPSSSSSSEDGIFPRIDELEQRIRVAYNYIFLLYCAAEGRVMPTGGYCLNEQDILDKWNPTWDGRMCNSLEKVIQHHDILDLGAGRGHYGRCFLRVKNNIIKTKNKAEIERMDKEYAREMERGGLTDKPQVVKSWTGYDGALNIEDLSGGFMRYGDLSQPMHLGKKYEWVMSLEVAEHVPKKYEANFVENLIRHACKGIILSWAVPGQPGHHHVNCKPMSYVKKLFESRGFISNSTAHNILRTHSRLHQYKHAFVFMVPPERAC